MIWSPVGYIPDQRHLSNSNGTIYSEMKKWLQTIITGTFGAERVNRELIHLPVHTKREKNIASRPLGTVSRPRWIGSTRSVCVYKDFNIHTHSECCWFTPAARRYPVVWSVWDWSMLNIWTEAYEKKYCIFFCHDIWREHIWELEYYHVKLIIILYTALQKFWSHLAHYFVYHFFL